jgi:hypothetical protein
MRLKRRVLMVAVLRLLLRRQLEILQQFKRQVRRNKQ